jgi:hypothetical protein
MISVHNGVPVATHGLHYFIPVAMHGLVLSFFVTIQYVRAQIIRALFVPIATYGKVYTVELVSLRRRAFRECVNFTNFAF